jgi:hypothetical protein
MIGNKPADFRYPTCHYCGHVTTDASLRAGYATVVCETCDLGNIFSDMWKEEYGSRPRFPTTAKFMRAFVRSYTTGATNG